MFGRGKDKDKEIKELKATIERQNREIIAYESILREKADAIQMRDALGRAKVKLEEQNRLLKQLTALPLVYAVVVAINRSEVTERFLLREGDIIRFLRPHARHTGEEAEITRVSKGDHPEVAIRFLSDNYETRIGDLSHIEQVGPVKKPEISDTAVVIFEGQQLEVKLPEHKTIEPGMTVKLAMETKQIVDVADQLYPGEIAIVRRVISKTMLEADCRGYIKTVMKNGEALEVGDRVILDASQSVVVKNLGKEDDQFSLKTDLNVKWEDVGGLENEKKEMIEAIEYPVRFKAAYVHYRKKPIKGILLWGPPGCGKTMLAKATATAMARLHEKETVETGFIYIKGPEILDRFVGTAETTIRQIFQRAKKHQEKNGYPAVIFIDEADAILGKRGTGISSDIERTIVPMFLAEMDGLEDSGAIVLLATNRPDILDPAVIREGRIDRKIKISRPNKAEAKEIFNIYLKSMPLSNGYTTYELANVVAEDLFSDEHCLYEISLNGSHKGEKMRFGLGNLASGAMIANIVDRATSIAMQRDIKGNGKSERGSGSGKKFDGLRKDDLLKAVKRVLVENIGTDHEDDLKDFVYDVRGDVIGIQKRRQVS